jgi:hypothetical protein
LWQSDLENIEMIEQRRLSVTTGSMNRLQPLLRALPTWLAIPEVDEVVIVDYGSHPPLLETLWKTVTDPRVRLVQVVGQRYWENARCHNLEWRLATGDYLLRLDNDYLLEPNFCQKHSMREGMFWAGNWRKIPLNIDDKRNLTGALFVVRRQLRFVNGYNERLVHYGKEDDDLYDRLVSSGLERLDIDLSTISHIPHADCERYKHLRIAAKLPDLCAKDPGWSWQYVVSQRTKERTMLVAMSTEISKKQPWTDNDRMTRWWRKPVVSTMQGCRGAIFEICEEAVDFTPRDEPWQLLI